MNGLSADPGWRGESGPLIVAAVLGVRVVPRSFPREPLPARVVENDDGDVGGAVPLERLSMASDDADDIALQPGVERRLDPRRQVLARAAAHHHLDEMRRQKRRRVAREAQSLVPRLARLFGRQRAGCLHAPKHRALPGDRLVAVAERVVARRPLRKAGQKRRLRRREHRRLGPEVDAARLSGADDLIAVGGEIEVEREDLALVEAMLEPQREHGLADLLPHASRRASATGDSAGASRPAA